MIERARKRLGKRAKRGFRGWPVATVALYGPDDRTATKLTVAIVPAEDAEATDLRRWLSKDQTGHSRGRPGHGRSVGVHHRGRSQIGRHDRPDYRLPTRRRHRLRGYDVSGLPVLGRTGSLDRQAFALAIAAHHPSSVRPGDHTLAVAPHVFVTQIVASVARRTFATEKANVISKGFLFRKA